MYSNAIIVINIIYNNNNSNNNNNNDNNNRNINNKDLVTKIGQHREPTLKLRLDSY